MRHAGQAIASVLSLLLLAGLASTTAPAGPPVQDQEGDRAQGLAAKYPNDGGIEKDPAVLFVEDFEEPSLDAVKKRWEDGLCPECGYDLRATPSRCPECGAVPSDCRRPVT